MAQLEYRQLDCARASVLVSGAVAVAAVDPLNGHGAVVGTHSLSTAADAGLDNHLTRDRRRRVEPLAKPARNVQA